MGQERLNRIYKKPICIRSSMYTSKYPWITNKQIYTALNKWTTRQLFYKSILTWKIKTSIKTQFLVCNSQGQIWVSIEERQSPAEDYTHHAIDLQQEDIQYICFSGLGIRRDISDGVGWQQCTIALPEAHGCMRQTGYHAPKPFLKGFCCCCCGD